MEENYYQMNGQAGTPQGTTEAGTHSAQSTTGYTAQNTTGYTAQSTEANTNTAQSYGAYQYSNERYVSDNYTYRNSGDYYNPYIRTQPDAQEAKQKKKKKASPVAKAIGVMVATICVAAAALLIAFSFLRVTDPSRKPQPDVPASGGSNIAANIEPSVVEPDVSTEQDEPVSDTPSASGSGSTIISTIQSTDMSAVVTDVTKVVEGAMPSVVIIDNNYTARARTIYGVYEEDATDTGSGVIIGKSDVELLIVSNNHVVAGANSLQVQFSDGSKVPAEIKGTNAGMDLAVVSVKLADMSAGTQGAIKVATLGDSDQLHLGEPVIAIGNALGYGQSVTTGVVSAVNREITMQDGTNGTFIQTDAAINPGNSGGALLNAKGEVVGINTAKLGGSMVDGMGFAIPITQAKDRIDRLMNIGSTIKYSDEDRGYMGITVYTPQGVSGAYVSTVAPDSAAAAGGMQEGDIIIAMDDLEISSRDDLINSLYYYPAGETVSVTVLRNSLGGQSEVNLKITLQPMGG